MWWPVMTPGELNLLKDEYNVLKGHEFRSVATGKGCRRPQGYAYKVEMYPVMFLNGLRLSFCRPVHDMLDMVGMALA